MADWTGSGLGDILCSDVHGYHRLFRNLGGGVTPPCFDHEKLLTFEGKPLKTVWRVRPAVTDWTGKGQLHYLALDADGVLSDWTRACVPDDPETGAPCNTTKQAGLFYDRNVGTPDHPRAFRVKPESLNAA